jgi:Protein of unknown function (DUF3224)
MQFGVSAIPQRRGSGCNGGQAPRREDSMPDRTHASAQIAVQVYRPAPYDEPAEGPSLVRIHVEETFTGDITGTGVVEFLQAARADGTASFVGIERVTGSVGGRSGTFLLQDQGTVADGVVSGDWFVVPGSGTGELTGLCGEGGFRADLGEGAAVTLDYWFE